MIELKPSTSKNLTNEEFLVRVINFSKHGALAQLVVLDALGKGLQHIVNGKEELLALQAAQEAKGEYPFINLTAWVAAAEDVLEQYNEKYSGK